MRGSTSALVAFFIALCGFSADFASADPVTPSPAPSRWSGFYAGGNIGYVWSPSSSIDKVAYFSDGDVGTVANGWFSGLDTSTADGLTAGIQAGYNAEANRWVLGIEGDLNYAGIESAYHASDSADLIPYPDDPDPTLASYNYHLRESLVTTSRLGWSASIRPRAGFAVTDSLLVYATGGVAFGGVKSSGQYGWRENGFWWCTPACGQNGDFDRSGGFAGSSTQFRIGWTAGAGAEFALTDKISFKAEYLYTDLGSRSHRLAFAGDGNDESIRWTDNAHFHTLRLGLNYGF